MYIFVFADDYFHRGVDMNDYRVRGDDVLEHVVDGTFGSVALSVVSPSARPALRAGRRPVGQTTAQRFVAIGIRALLVIRIEVSVGQMKHFELRYWFLQGRYRLIITKRYYFPDSENGSMSICFVSTFEYRKRSRNRPGYPVFVIVFIRCRF